MKAGTLKRVMSRPATSPFSEATSRASGMASHIGTPATTFR